MHTGLITLVFAAMSTTPMFAQKGFLPRCDGDPALVRVTQIKPTSSYDAFLKAQEAQVAWYRQQGFADPQIYSTRVAVFDQQTQTMKDSDTVLVFHVRPPVEGQSLAARDQVGWNAFVQQYRDTSDVRAEYAVCLPKSR